MSRAVINLDDERLNRLRRHLLPARSSCEEAAFLFARPEHTSDGLVFEVVEIYLVPPEGFTARSEYYLELSDATRAAVIKKAHDLDAALIEFHSHPKQREACFSWSDLHGFDEFVPHVMWRLNGRPYAAVVMALDSIDALFWLDARGRGTQLDGLASSSGLVPSSGLTVANWGEIYDSRTL